MRALAEAAVFGLPVDRMINSRDGAELALLEKVRVESAQVIDDLLTALARKIVKEQADAQERGRKKQQSRK